MSNDEVGSLADRDCVPCRRGVPKLTPEQCAPLLAQLDGWVLVTDHHLSREFAFEDFVTALAFVNRVAQIAERYNHHPDVYLAWGKVRLDIWTHTIDGLAEGDFVLAAKCDRSFKSQDA